MLSDFERIYTYSSSEIPLHSSSPFPLIIFCPGYDSGPYAYTAFCEGLASQGYIVCFINYPYVVSLVSFPDGRHIFLKAPPNDQLIEVCTQDIYFILNTLSAINSEDPLLKEGINFQSITMVGHSLGGMLSLNCTNKIKEIKAGVSLDATVDPSLLGVEISSKVYDATQEMKKPFIHLLAGNHEEIYGHSPLKFNEGIKNFQIIIDQTSHNSFSDYCLYKNLIPWLSSLKGNMDTGDVRGVELVSTVLNHINKFLRAQLS
jgi:pimeloyl-ACP methyl ester carboxylesterase